MTTDLFSKQSALYSAHRPQYPEELYRFLAAETPAKRVAWDCATGNGQAALDLSRHFERVIATDLSEVQLRNAAAAKNVEYRALPAESPLSEPDASVDLVTVAQAIHWFDLGKFYAEAKRVLKPGGVIAAWAYGFQAPIRPEIDRALDDFHFGTLGPFWKPNNRLIWNDYRELDFPFREIPAPTFRLAVEWTLAEWMGYVRTWSATQLYVDRHGVDPTLAVAEKIAPYWGEGKRPVEWKLALRVGRR